MDTLIVIFCAWRKNLLFSFVCHIVVIASYFTDGVQHVRLFPADVRGARGLVRLVSQVKVFIRQNGRKIRDTCT